MSLELGQWNVICDQCGVKRKSSQVLKRWDGLIVCSPATREGCFEHRHPQDFVRVVREDQSVPFTRPEAADQFVAVTFNCDTAEPIYYPAHIGADVTIAKGIVMGTLFVEDCTITVLCSLEIR